MHALAASREEPRARTGNPPLVLLLQHIPSQLYLLSTGVSPPEGGGGGCSHPSGSAKLNSIFSAKTDPRENPEKIPEYQ
jgi:hypothetical protein